MFHYLYIVFILIFKNVTSYYCIVIKSFAVMIIFLSHRKVILKLIPRFDQNPQTQKRVNKNIFNNPFFISERVFHKIAILILCTFCKNKTIT